MTLGIEWRSLVRLGMVGGIALTGLLPDSAMAALSDGYRYKFPCPAGASCYVTTLGHSQDALDFDISGSSNGPVRAVSEGQVTNVTSDVNQCDVSQPYLGRYVVVQDIFGRSLTYAHLSSYAANLHTGQWVLQGDPLGVEGDTGYTLHWDGQQWVPCGVHLHLTNVASLSYVDNQTVNHLGAYTSTNSVIGEIGGSQQGQAIRDEYLWLGQQAGNRSWYVVGWTSDNRGPGTGLSMRREGAGYEQTFNHDAGYGCSGHSGIYVSDNRPGEGHWVDYCLWDTWTGPASNYPSASGRGATGYPRTEPSSAYCPSQLAGCVKFQAFYDGYVWMNSSAQVQSVAAPDVDGNGVVNFMDAISVAKAALKYPYRYDAGCDVNADGQDNFVVDVLQTAKIALIESYKRPAYQSRVPGGISCTPQ